MNKTSFKERYQTEFCDEERMQEDDFRIGMAISRKGNIKLYAHFDKADIIVAAPLGLALINEGDPQK
jgi:U3 small nucleolar RNA-associated protein 25